MKLCALFLLLAGAAASAQDPVITPFSTAAAGAAPPPWRLLTLPKLPRHTRFEVAELDGARALRVDAEASYANLVHPLDAAAGSLPVLSWRWRVERFPANADLRRKQGDDTAARLCVLFDLPDSRLSFGLRMQLKMARALFDPNLPAASICYVWDEKLPPNTWLPNAHTDRVQMLVLEQGNPGRWAEERRDVQADFARAFPSEAAGGFRPRIAAIGVAADGDSTGGSSLSWFGDIRLEAR
jgi:hypothetical protein